MSEKIPNGLTCGDCRNFGYCRSLILTMEADNTKCDWSPHKFKISDKARADAAEALLLAAVNYAEEVYLDKLKAASSYTDHMPDRPEWLVRAHALFDAKAGTP